MFDSKGFEELSEDTVCFILASDNLMLDEMEIYNCVRRWANVNAVSQIMCTSAVGSRQNLSGYC